MKKYPTAQHLIQGEHRQSLFIECGSEASRQVFDAVRSEYYDKRCAFLLVEDGGFERESVRSHLKLFARIANTTSMLDDTLQIFQLSSIQSKKLKECDASERGLTNFARVSLLKPEVCFVERPLSDLRSDARRAVLNWIETQVSLGVVFISTLDPFRIAILMPGKGFWFEDGFFSPIELEEVASAEEEIFFAGDEVEVYKVPAKAEGSTLLFEPKEIDFIESMNKNNYVSVRGSLFQTNATMDELEVMLSRFGFFRCHRSYIVNVQKVIKVERYTRNSFNLVLNDTSNSTIPLSKGRAEEMRSLYGW